MYTRCVINVAIQLNLSIMKMNLIMQLLLQRDVNRQ